MAFTQEPSARSRGKDASRQRLLEAAAAVFADKGFSAAKAADIAESAGVAVGTLYLHYGDKNGIARAVALEALGELRKRLRAAVEDPALVGEKAARAHAAALVDFVADARNHGRLLFAADAPGLRSEILDAMAAAQEAQIRERQRDGYFRSDIDAVVAAQALVAMQSGLLSWWMANRRRASRERIIETLAKLRFSGIHTGKSAGSTAKRQMPSPPSKRMRSRRPPS